MGKNSQQKKHTDDVLAKEVLNALVEIHKSIPPGGCVEVNFVKDNVIALSNGPQGPKSVGKLVIHRIETTIDLNVNVS